MEKTSTQLFEEFAAQLCQWEKTGNPPPAADQNIRYGFSLQKNRLRKYNADISYELKPAEDDAPQDSGAVYSETAYSNRLVSKSYQKIVNYYLEGKKRLTLKEDETLYTFVTWLKQDAVSETYCCPNCSTVSEIKVLLGGCPNCSTRFLMSDLFPKVTGYHFLHDYTSIKKRNISVRRFAFIGAVIMLIIIAPQAVSDFIQGGKDDTIMFFRVLLLTWQTVLSLAIGSALGYCLYVIKLLFSLIGGAIKSAPAAAGILTSRKKLTELMRNFDPSFTFEYFIGNIQSLLKIFIYSDKRENLAVYIGPPAENKYNQIIDAQFDGAINLNHCHVEGNYCYLDLIVYMTNVYCQNDKLKKKSEIIKMGVCKNITHPFNNNFSIKKVTCKSCAASFDASMERHCPYCGNSYDLKEDDWVITYIK